MFNCSVPGNWGGKRSLLFNVFKKKNYLLKRNVSVHKKSLWCSLPHKIPFVTPACPRRLFHCTSQTLAPPHGVLPQQLQQDSPQMIFLLRFAFCGRSQRWRKATSEKTCPQLLSAAPLPASSLLQRGAARWPGRKCLGGKQSPLGKVMVSSNTCLCLI